MTFAINDDMNLPVHPRSLNKVNNVRLYNNKDITLLVTNIECDQIPPMRRLV